MTVRDEPPQRDGYVEAAGEPRVGEGERDSDEVDDDRCLALEVVPQCGRQDGVAAVARDQGSGEDEVGHRGEEQVGGQAIWARAGSAAEAEKWRPLPRR